MSSFFVDMVRLSERYEEGMRLKQPVMEDLTKLEDDVSAISEEMRKQGDYERAVELDSLINEISGTVRNITDVCRFDSFAVRKYKDLQMKIDDIVSAVEV